MYKLENNVEWTENLKNAFKHGITRGKIKYTNDNNQEVVIDYDNGLKRFKLYDEKNVPNQGFIGQATARQVDLELINTININNLENKEFELFLGADYNNQTYYINYGKFIVNQAPENDLTNGIIKITAFDYMIKANIPYVPVVTFPCTLKAVVDDICVQIGLELATLDFANADCIEDGNQFDGKTCKEVLRHVGKSAFSWVRIGQDNKLYIDYEVKDLLDFKLAEIDGDTFQQTYTGKNVFNKARTPDKLRTASASALATGIKVTNTATGSNHAVGYDIGKTSDLYGKTIRISTDVSVSGQNEARIYINVAPLDYSSRTAKVEEIGTGHKELSYTVTDNDENKVILISFYCNWSSQATGVYAEFKNLIITIDNEDLTYEPYTNKLPAPNPDYPQDIQVVTGDNNIKIQNKNICNRSNRYNANLMYARYENGGLSNTVTLSFKTDVTVSGVSIYPVNLQELAQTVNITANQRVSVTFNLTNDQIKTTMSASSPRFNISKNNANWTSISEVQIENNSVATEYIAHQEQNYPISLGSIELAKIGNYQDKIIKKSDGWYLHKEIAKISNVELLSAYFGVTGSGIKYFTVKKSLLGMKAEDTTTGIVLCNKFKEQVNINNRKPGEFLLNVNKSVIQFIVDNSYSSLEEVQAGIPNIICYCVLETPTDTQITDATLISQLNALYNAKLYEGKNYIIPQAEANNLTGTYIFNTSKSSLTIADVTSIDTTTYDMADKITLEDYYQDKFKTANKMYGAINRVVYADSNIQGQEEKVEDTDDIAINGVHELTIYDNYFAYTTEKRQQLIQAGTRLFGMKYMPIQQLEMVGLAYLDCNDILEVTSPDNNKFPILPLNHIIEYNGVVKDSLTSETNSTTETNYKNTNAPINANSLTEIIVDRAMREIKMIVDQYVNFLHNKSGNNNIFIDGTRDGQGFITKFVIKGSTTYFDENIITLVISEGIKNQETTLITEVEDTLFTEAGDSIIGETKTLYIDKTQIVLDDVLRSLVVDNITYYDELQILQDGTIQVIRRIGVAPNETLYLLDKEEITILDQKFVLTAKEEGLYYFIEEIDNLDYYAEYIIKNEYSDIYATEAYVNAGLDLKVNSENLVSELNASADIIKLVGQRLIILMQNYSLDEKGYMKALVGEIAGFLFSDKKFSKEFDTVYNFTAEDVNLLVSYLNGYATLNNSIENLYNLTGDSTLNVLDAIRMIEIIHNEVENTSNIKGSIAIKSDNTNELIEITNDLNINKTRLGIFTMYSYLMRADVIALADVQTSGNVEINGIILDKAKRKISVIDGSSETIILPTGITTPTLTQTSRADDKKDFEKLENALDEVMNTDIYKYHLKSQSEEDKKHVGFVIGSDFKYSHLITAENQERQEIGVDPYAMVSVLWKAVQEQQEQIEELKKEIKKLKGE